MKPKLTVYEGGAGRTNDPEYGLSVSSGDALKMLVVALAGAVLLEVGVYFALGVETWVWLALSLVVFFASLWHGQFWLAVLILLWWIWLS